VNFILIEKCRGIRKPPRFSVWVAENVTCIEKGTCRYIPKGRCPMSTEKCCGIRKPPRFPVGCYKCNMIALKETCP